MGGRNDDTKITARPQRRREGDRGRTLNGQPLTLARGGRGVRRRHAATLVCTSICRPRRRAAAKNGGGSARAGVCGGRHPAGRCWQCAAGSMRPAATAAAAAAAASAAASARAAPISPLPPTEAPSPLGVVVGVGSGQWPFPPTGTPTTAGWVAMEQGKCYAGSERQRLQSEPPDHGRTPAETGRRGAVEGRRKVRKGPGRKQSGSR